MHIATDHSRFSPGPKIVPCVSLGPKNFAMFSLVPKAYLVCSYSLRSFLGLGKCLPSFLWDSKATSVSHWGQRFLHILTGVLGFPWVLSVSYGLLLYGLRASLGSHRPEVFARF